MKPTLLLIALASSALAFLPQAEARPPVNAAHAELTNITVDPRLGWEGLTGTGSVEVDFQERSIRLFLEKIFVCPAGRYCIQSTTDFIRIDLPIISTSRDRCGSVEYRALRDRSDRDGLREILIVKDHSGNFCETPHFEPYVPTEVIYRTFSPRTRTATQSIMTATALTN